MNDELDPRNNTTQQAQQQPAPQADEVMAPDAEVPMDDPIEGQDAPEIKKPSTPGTFTPPVEGMIPIGWAFPQDLSDALAMETEDPEVAATGVDETNKNPEDVAAPTDTEDMPESAKAPRKNKRLHEDEDQMSLDDAMDDLGDSFEAFKGDELDPEDPEYEEEDVEDHDDIGLEDISDDLEEDPEKIPDLLDIIARVLQDDTFEDIDDEEEEEEEDEDEDEDLEDEDGEEDEDDLSDEDPEDPMVESKPLKEEIAVKYPAGSEPAPGIDTEFAPYGEDGEDGEEFIDSERPRDLIRNRESVDSERPIIRRGVSRFAEAEDDIIRQYEKRARARREIIARLKKPLWERELDDAEIADTDELDKEIDYKSINAAVDEGSLNEKFNEALKNSGNDPAPASSNGWASRNSLGMLNEKRLDFRSMIEKGFLNK